MLTGWQEGLPLEINGGSDIWTVAFAANGEYIVGSGSDGLGVWRVEDGKRMATMAAGDVNCLAVSKDGRWIAGDANVWDAKTFEKVFTHRPREEEHLDDILAVDFSPDSTRLLVALKNQIATVWDIAARNKVLTLHSKGWMRAAKYSSQGDRIATATRESVRVWDSNDGHLLVDIPVKVSPLFNTGLIWSNNHLFVVSDSTITQLEASTGSTVSKLSVADTNDISSIALPKHGEFIAYSTIDTVTFWDPSTHAQLGLIQHPQTIHSIAHSPDDRFLAIVGLGGKITIRSLSRITVSRAPSGFGGSEQLSCSASLSKLDSIPLSCLHHTLQEPVIQIDDAALHSWKHDQLDNADALFTAAILEYQNPNHHLLASRALVRARSRQWDAALVDAEEVLITLFSHTRG